MAKGAGVDTQVAAGPAGPAEAPRRSLSVLDAVVAVATGWLLALAAGLLLAAQAAGWPGGGRWGFLVVSVAALGAVVWSQWVSRARAGGARTGPTTWTVPDARTQAQRRERDRRFEDALSRGEVVDAERPAAVHLVRKRLASAGTSMLTAAIPTVLGLTNLADADGGFSTAVSVLLVVVGAALMATSTVAVLRWRRRAHRSGLGR